MKQITVRKKCNECDEELEYTGNAYSNSIGTSYEHKCGCSNEKEGVLVSSALVTGITTIHSAPGKAKFFNTAYPYTYIEFEENEKEERWE